MNKYELTDQSMKLYDKTLYRIRALMDFSIVKAGDIGGFVEKESNLSQYGNCWIYDNAKVYDNARVSGYAKVYDNARVFDNVEVNCDARIFDTAIVYDNARVFDNAKVYDNAAVFDNAKVNGNARVFDNANVFGYAEVYDNAVVFDNAKVNGNARVFDNAKVCGNAIVTSKILTATIGNHNITVTDKHIRIGRVQHTFDHWKDNIIEIGKDNDYSDVEIGGITKILTGLLMIGGK